MTALAALTTELRDSRASGLARGRPADDLRSALRRLARSVVIVTAVHEGRRYAMAATAVVEVSLEPPSMLVCVNRAASIHEPLAAGSPFALNILSSDQREIAAVCSGKVKGEERFQAGDWTRGPRGVPCLTGAQATIVCASARCLEHGTHGVFIGAVLEVLVTGPTAPLIHLDGRFGGAGWN